MTPLQILNKSISGDWTIAGNDVGYRIEEDDTTVCLYFEYTHDKAGWLSDFDFPILPYKNMPYKWYAHGGFVKLYKSVRDKLFSDITSRIGNKNLLIAGYSQGAALTCLAHEDFYFSTELHNRIHSYAFASPRVFWLPSPALKIRLSQLSVYRYWGDLVPMVPPASWGFRHCGNYVKLDKYKFPMPKYHYPRYYQESLQYM